MEHKDYFTPDEIEKITGVKKHILRYWEKKFDIISPVRLSSGHRRYTKLDIENIERVKSLIAEGYSLSGIKKIIKRKDSNSSSDYLVLRYQKILKEINQKIKDIISEL